MLAMAITDEPISPNITANMNGKVTMAATAGFLPLAESHLKEHTLLDTWPRHNCR